ncbi:hypothetical protein CDAR_426441 [Caerostris darwini]|uniref:Cuticle protein 64 n=1 Tax=Caerostris darwini TaxID=1538125 RepID=A0AAV4T545_9ARAC|nr:hypothetical protein CDAR_387141 [Caerostris darwini]GIY40022.1 hypothetical protein CDAR_426441 [Caerostris darwini]
MIAKVVILCAALAAAHATLLTPAVHGLAIRAPVAPLLHAPIGVGAPLLSKTVVAAPVLTKTVVAAPAAVTVQREVITSHHAAPVAVAAPVYTTTITRAAPVASVLGHSGLLGAAPLAYGLGYGSGVLGHGVGYSGIAGHGLAYGHGGHGLAYGHGLGYGKLGYGKYLL